MLSTRRTAVVALHSTSCSRLFLFSYLVVDKLLLVLLPSRCKVLLMGTPIFHDRLAWVIRLDLPPRKIVDELDYCGSFVDFADIVWLWRVLRLWLHWVHNIILKRLCGSCLIIHRDSWSFMGDLDWKHDFWRKYALEAIIILLLSYFLFMIMFIFHARIVLSGNINTCVVYRQHCVPSTPLLV
jgi:hypothetical protein